MRETLERDGAVLAVGLISQRIARRGVFGDDLRTW